jgi:hypothetical protein
MKNIHKINNNIYITSDEKPKKGDWVFNEISKEVYKITNVDELVIYEKKIILTTDFRLAPDVQKIDDEFLEWFVKNSSCESVEVDYDYIQVYPRSGRDAGGNERYEYICKIIIPQEEPKQEELKFKNRQIGAAGFVANQIMENMINKPKQETLEEFINEELEDVFFTNISKRKEAERLIELGAKWQQEQNKNKYNEKDMKQFAFECVANFLSNNDNQVEIKLVDVIIDRLNNQFEQFKKKKDESK